MEARRGRLFERCVGFRLPESDAEFSILRPRSFPLLAVNDDGADDKDAAAKAADE